MANSNYPYRLLAVDVDGTLVTTRNELPDRNRQALHRAHEAGLKVCLCTGRSLTETREVLNRLNLNLDAGVFVFGAVVSDLREHRTIHRGQIPAPLAHRLLAFFRQHECPILMLFDVVKDGIDYRVLRGRKNLDAYDRWIERSPATIEWVDDWSPDISEPLRIGVIVDPAEVPQLTADLCHHFGTHEVKCNSIFAPNYGLHVLECFAPQINKWYGINHLIRPWRIEPSEVIAVGDDINDLEMISQAGLGVAMGNAIEPVKAVAKWHVPTNDECGVAALIDRLLDSV